tara:strand:+ start:60 stop:446 length:387 start_codon:yes stop_codon:yes gene_type:complete
MPNVYIVQRPKMNKYGWVPDLTDASRYGKLVPIFEDNDNPQFLPGPSIQKARRILKSFSPDDYLLWAGGGDPTAVMIVSMIAGEVSPIVNVLRWERNIEQGGRDRRVGWYMPLTLELRKESSYGNKSA